MAIFINHLKNVDKKVSQQFFTLKLLLVFIIVQKAENYTDSTKINRPGYTYVCTERIFDSRLLMYNKIFLEELM